MRVWIAALLALGGCVDLKASYPERRFYTLDAARSGDASPGPAGSVLRVRRFTSSKLCEGNDFVTRIGEGEYESDFYNSLFAAPTAQLGEQTHRWMGAAGLFASVVGTGSSVPETHVLEGNLIALHRDARNASAPTAVLEMQFMLVNVSADPPRVLLQKTYRQELAVAAGEPAALVKGWSDGLRQIMTGLEQDLSKIDRAPRR